jgi:hypothetical protein
VTVEISSDDIGAYVCSRAGVVMDMHVTYDCTLICKACSGVVVALEIAIDQNASARVAAAHRAFVNVDVTADSYPAVEAGKLTQRGFDVSIDC